MNVGEGSEARSVAADENVNDCASLITEDLVVIESPHNEVMANLAANWIVVDFWVLANSKRDVLADHDDRVNDLKRCGEDV